MLKFLMLLSFVSFIIGSVRSDVADAEIKKHIIAECSVIDDIRFVEKQHDFAMRKCGWNTNRYVQLSKELSTNVTGIAKRNLLANIAWYGDASDSQYLYGYLTDPEMAPIAARGIIRVEGVTSNSIDRISGFLCAQDFSQRERSEVCGDLFEAVCSSAVPDAVREYGVSNVTAYAETANRFFMRLDQRMCITAPAYRYSVERLRVLRAVADPQIHYMQYQYITNAIRELVEYPEAELSGFVL